VLPGAIESKDIIVHRETPTTAFCFYGNGGKTNKGEKPKSMLLLTIKKKQKEIVF